MTEEKYLKKRLDTYCAALNEHFKPIRGIFNEESLRAVLRSLSEGDICQVLSLTHGMLIIRQRDNYAFYDPNESRFLLSSSGITLEEVVRIILYYSSEETVEEQFGCSVSGALPLWFGVLSNSMKISPNQASEVEQVVEVVPQQDLFHLVAAYLNTGRREELYINADGVCYGLTLILRELISQYGSVAEASKIFYSQLKVLAHLQNQFVLEGSLSIQEGNSPQVLSRHQFAKVHHSPASGLIYMIEMFHVMQHHLISAPSSVRKLGQQHFLPLGAFPCAVPLSVAYPTNSRESCCHIMNPQVVYELFHWPGASRREQFCIDQKILSSFSTIEHGLLVDKTKVSIKPKHQSLVKWDFVSSVLTSDAEFMLACIANDPSIALKIAPVLRNDARFIRRMLAIPFVVTTLIQAGDYDALIEAHKTIDSVDGIGLMQRAALNDRPDVVSLLLELGESTQTTSQEGLKPLGLAVRHNRCLDVIKCLMDDARSKFQGRVDMTALGFIALKSGNSVALDFLLQMGLSVNTLTVDKSSFLMLAVEDSHFHCMESLLVYGADVHAENACGETALDLAYDHRNWRCYGRLISEGATPFVQKGMTLLDLLVRAIDFQSIRDRMAIFSPEDLAQIIINSKEDTQDKVLGLLFEDAVMSNKFIKYLDIFEIFVVDQLFRLVECMITQRGMLFPLMIALSNVVYRYEDKASQNLILPILSRIVSRQGETVLMKAVASNQFALVEDLIKIEADIHQRDCLGRTALMYAVHLSKTRMLDLLLKNGADIFLKTVNGETAITFAVEGNRGGCLHILLRSMDNNDLTRMVREGSINTLKLLAKRLYEYQAYSYLVRILCVASDHGKTMTDQLKLDYGNDSKALALVCVSYSSCQDRQSLLKDLFETKAVNIHQKDLVCLIFHAVYYEQEVLLRHVLRHPKYHQGMLGELNRRGNTVFDEIKQARSKIRDGMLVLLKNAHKRQPLVEISVFKEQYGAPSIEASKDLGDGAMAIENNKPHEAILPFFRGHKRLAIQPRISESVRSLAD